MKKLYFLAIVAAIIATGCEPQVKTEPVDQNALNTEITQLADKYLNAWNSENIEVLSSMIADDGLFVGSDPTELMDKASLIKMYSNLFSDTLTDFSYDIDIRNIKLADDGKSAIVVEYFNIKDWSPIIPLRQTSQFVYNGDSWQIDFIAWGLIVKNENVDKLNKALE